VLDYSSSMDGSKYQSMRDGAIDLIKLLTDDLTSPSVKIGLVPFAEEVYLSLPGEHVIGGTLGTTWTNCTNDRKWPFTNSDTTPTADIESKWGRTDSNDTIDPTEYDDCANYPAASLVVRPLTDDHSGTVAQLETMVPYEGTNVALGLQFGWQVLSANAPFTEGVSDGSKSKIIILLTDGRQHADGWGADNNHTVDNAISNIDAGCLAIKSSGITIVTVAYELDDDDGKAQLETCASTGEFYLEGDESSIADQFSDVGHALLNRHLHLTM
ncbi:MAG: VWA domain-containing protein, partial [Alphaproteobacteria bacterium]|nr:VWA domain-containing protein [Alphaproteobacteria bacterium]